MTTGGVRHGPGYAVIIDGCPPGLPLSADDLLADLRRRRVEDIVADLGGVHGRTHGGSRPSHGVAAWIDEGFRHDGFLSPIAAAKKYNLHRLFIDKLFRQ